MYIFLVKRLLVVALIATIFSSCDHTDDDTVYEIEGSLWFEKGGEVETTGFRIENDQYKLYECSDGRIENSVVGTKVVALDEKQFTLETSVGNSKINYSLKSGVLTVNYELGSVTFSKNLLYGECSGADDFVTYTIPICLYGRQGDGFCDIDCNNETENFDGGDCECSSVDVGNDDCDLACMTEANNYDNGECESYCGDTEPGDGICDLECYSSEFDFDGGDCEVYEWE